MNDTFQAKNASEKYIAGYRIITELAASTSSRVFLAEACTAEQSPVVVKLFYSTIIDIPYEFAHLLADMYSIHRLQHPNILPILDAGISIYTPYVVVPYIETESLYERMQQSGAQPIPIEDALKILLQIGQALDYAHQHHIFYGKLKPRNVFFAKEDGRVQLADFTSIMVYKTGNGGYFTNPDAEFYMAPEQFTGTLDASSDQYALGCLAYELFTTHKPFKSAFYAPQRREDPIKPRHLNPNLPPFIEYAILKAIAREPEQRYPDMLSFIHALTIAPHAAVTEIIVENVSISEALHIDKDSKKDRRVATSSLSDRNKSGIMRIYQQKMLRKLLLLASCIMLMVILIGGLLSSSLLFARPSTSLLATNHTVTAMPQGGMPAKKTQFSPSSPNSVKKAIAVIPTLTQATPTQSLARSTITPTPVAATPTSVISKEAVTDGQLQVSPTSFTTANCVLDNNNYRCTATLQLSKQFVGHLDWQFSTAGISTTFNFARGVIRPGQKVQLIIYISATCPATGRLLFLGDGNTAMATWSC